MGDRGEGAPRTGADRRADDRQPAGLRHRARRVLATLGRVQLAGAPRRVSAGRARERPQQLPAGDGGARARAEAPRSSGWSPRRCAGRSARRRPAPRSPRCRAPRSPPSSSPGLAVIRCSSPRPPCRSGSSSARPAGAGVSRERLEHAARHRHRHGPGRRRHAAAVPHDRGDEGRRPRARRHRRVGLGHPRRSERYRTAVGRATLFVPTATGFKLKVKPLTDHPVDLELRLDGRIADRRQLLPGGWTEIRMPARTRRAQGHFAPLELRVYGRAGARRDDPHDEGGAAARRPLSNLVRSWIQIAKGLAALAAGHSLRAIARGGYRRAPRARPARPDAPRRRGRHPAEDDERYRDWLAAAAAIPFPDRRSGRRRRDRSSASSPPSSTRTRHGSSVRSHPCAIRPTRDGS